MNKLFRWGIEILAVGAVLFGLYTFNANSPAVRNHAAPSYCYSTGEWLPFPNFSGYCPDGESPFNGPGPSYGGGNHRWPDGSDD